MLGWESPELGDCGTERVTSLLEMTPLGNGSSSSSTTWCTTSSAFCALLESRACRLGERLLSILCVYMRLTNLLVLQRFVYNARSIHQRQRWFWHIHDRLVCHVGHSGFGELPVSEEHLQGLACIWRTGQAETRGCQGGGWTSAGPQCQYQIRSIRKRSVCFLPLARSLFLSFVRVLLFGV